MKFLDHLEEWIIATLMGAATLVIFVAVVHRYVSGLPIPGVQDSLIKLNTSWAQELCIYMFVWMAKFGAAYGVRTGIHVGVDVLINRMNAPWRRQVRRLRPAGRRRLHRHRRHPGRHLRLAHVADRPDLGRPGNADVDRLPGGAARLLPDVLPLPAGAGAFLRTGELPKHDHAHVEGLEDEIAAAKGGAA